jgi:hypothetical protein
MEESKLFSPWNLESDHFIRISHAGYHHERLSRGLRPRCNPRTRCHWVVRHAERQPANVCSGYAILALAL